MSNLYTEIIEQLVNHGKSEEDVKWAGNKDFKIPLEKFWKIAHTHYNNGFGSPKVAEDLIVAGDNFWLERHEYDGSEWFEYKESPKMPDKEIDIDCLTVEQHNEKYKDNRIGWETLYSLNGMDSDES